MTKESIFKEICEREKVGISHIGFMLYRIIMEAMKTYGDHRSYTLTKRLENYKVNIENIRDFANKKADENIDPIKEDFQDIALMASLLLSDELYKAMQSDFKQLTAYTDDRPTITTNKTTEL